MSELWFERDLGVKEGLWATEMVWYRGAAVPCKGLMRGHWKLTVSRTKKQGDFDGTQRPERSMLGP